MAQRRHHYERAFEEYLRSRRIPYVSVDEARKALIPSGPVATVAPGGSPDDFQSALKSFDFVIYGQDGNLLIDIKGRRVASRGRMSAAGVGGVRFTPATRSRLESWVTQDDVSSLVRWESLFGSGFRAAFVFVYWCIEQPPDALFQEVFEYRGRWYALRAVTLDAYQKVMKPRSLRWRTVDVPSAIFERISQPFAPSLASAPNPLNAEPMRSRSSSTQVSSAAPSSDTGLCSLDDPDFRGDFGPQLPALHPYTSSTPR